MTKDDMTILQAIKAAMAEIENHHADMLTEEERNRPGDSGWARVYDKLAAAREVVLSTDKERDRLTIYLIRALELTVPVLREVVASGLLGADEWSDRLALDAAESILATAKPKRAA